MKPMSLTILVYQTASGKKPYEKWLNGIKDSSTRFRILARVRQMSVGGLGDVKSVGGGVNEARLDFGPGYRI
jgi:putative addiction module killer protein